MKKIILLLTLIFGAFCAKSQTIDFLGVEICNADTTSLCSVLKDKGYTYFGANKKSIMYTGKFAGVDATAMIVPFEGSDIVNAVVISMKNLSPMKMGNLYTELLQKFMNKYKDFKYETGTDAKGSITTSFSCKTGWVAIQTDITAKGGGYGLSIYYHCNKESDAANNNVDEAINNDSGIGLDDI